MRETYRFTSTHRLETVGKENYKVIDIKVTEYRLKKNKGRKEKGHDQILCSKYGLFYTFLFKLKHNIQKQKLKSY